MNNDHQIPKRKDLPEIRLSDSETNIPVRKVNVPDVPKTKPHTPMLKRILGNRIIKGIISLVGGVVGFTGSTFAGLDPEFAFIVAVTAVIALFGGMEKAAKFKGLFDDDLNKPSNTNLDK